MRKMLIAVLALLAAGVVLWTTGLLETSSTNSGSPSREANTGSADLTVERADRPRLEGQEAGVERASELPETPEPQVIPEGAILLEGRVIDDRRIPIEGAHVATTWPPGAQTPTRLEDVTDADGRYRLVILDPIDGYNLVIIQATKATRAGHTSSYVGLSTDGGVPDIILKPTQRVEVQVLDIDGGPRPGAQVHVVQRSGWRLGVIRRGMCSEEGRVTFDGVPVGDCLIAASAPGRGKVTTKLALSNDVAGAATLRLTNGRTQTVRVIRKKDEAPIPGATLTVYEYLKPTNSPTPGVSTLREPPFEDLVTNEDGIVVLRGLGESETISIAAKAEGYTGHRGIGQLRTSNDEYRIVMQQMRTVRLPLAADNPHAPEDQSVVELEIAPGTITREVPEQARIDGNELVIENAPGGVFHAIAVAPSGAFARVFSRGDDSEEREVVFEKPRIVSIHVKHADGSPAVGFFVTARNQGNNVVVQPTPLDEDGRAELKIRYGWLLDFYVDQKRVAYGRQAIGSLDLKEKQAGLLEATLQLKRTVLLRISYLGERRLPAVFYCRGADVIEEDPVQSTLRVAVAPSDKATRFTIGGTDFLAHVVDVPPGTADDEAEIDVALGRGGELLLRLQPPPDAPAQLRLRPSDKTDTRAGFTPMGGSGHRQEDVGHEGAWTLKRFSLIKPGEYVAQDRASGAESRVFRISEGEETRVDLDLSKAGWIEGRLEVPSGHDPRQGRILRLRKGQARPPPQQMFYSVTTRVKADGTFRVRVPGNEAITLEAYHPSLIPSEPGGRVTLTTPRKDVLLQMVEGASLTFRFDHADEGRRTASSSPVELRPASNNEAPWRPQPATAADGVVTASGITPGKYDIRINKSGFAPLVIPGREIVDATDLGTLTLSKGGRIRIKLLIKEGEDPPRIFASARMAGAAGYVRFINSRGELEVLLEGLGRGTFELNARPMRGMTTSGSRSSVLQESIESDGESEIVVEFDLR